MIEQQLREGIALAKAGKNLEARSVLGQVVKNDPRSVLGWLWLSGVVETKEQQRYCLEKVLQFDPRNEAARRVLAQVRANTVREVFQPRKIAQPQVAAGPQYSEDREDFKSVITAVFGSLGYEPYYTGRSADEGLEGQPLLLDICQQIFSASFGVFDLSAEDPSGYLEMGIALGLNRPIVATVKERTPLPAVLEGHHVITYADYSDLEAKLARLCDQDFPPTAQPVPDYCCFCGRVCESMSIPPDENAYLVLSQSKLLWRNLMESLAPHLAEYHLYPVYLSDRVSGPGLCDMRRKVLAAQFVLCHLGALSDESSFLSLGMAVGSRVPWVLLSGKDHDPVPSDLQGVDRIEYATLADLEGPLTEALGVFLGRITAGSVVKNDKTALLSLPFWVQLGDWIDRVAQPARASEVIQGRIRVVRYRGQMRLSEHVVPEEGLLFGRDPECDVVVENQGVSSRHFRILKGRTGKTFVEDLHSKNGTFLNGTRLPPGKRVEVKPNDAIRIPGARFLIWNGRPLPQEEAPQTFGDTSLLPPILKIEIPDVAPPTYLSTWNHSLVLTIVLPDGHHRAMFEVQGYYPVGRILSELVGLLDLPERKYHFMIENKLIDDDETPLSIGIQRGDLLIMTPEK
jgi:hypothetical protein